MRSTPSPRFMSEKTKGARDAHALRIPLHHVEIGADMRGQILLIDDEQVRAGDARPALARDFLALADGNHIDRQVGQVRREGCRQIVAAGFDEDHVKIGKTPVEIGYGLEVDRGVLADRSVRAAARLDADDALRRQRLHAHQRLRVLLRVDVVGDDGDGIVFAQRPCRAFR
jgi:hypothetical protein